MINQSIRKFLAGLSIACLIAAGGLSIVGCEKSGSSDKSQAVSSEAESAGMEEQAQSSEMSESQDSTGDAGMAMPEEAGGEE